MYPILLSIYGINFYTYGFFASLSFIAGWLVLSLLAKHEKLTDQQLFDKIFWVIIAALLGARLSYLLIYWQQFDHWWQFFYVGHGGLTSYGGMFGALIIFILLFKNNLWKWLDTLALSFLLGLFFWRIGCTLISDHPAQASSWWWAINGQIPVIFLESLSGLLGFFIFLWLKNKFSLKPGWIFWLVFSYYGLVRMLVDHWRIDPNIIFNLHLGQIIGFLMLVTGLLAIIRMIMYDKTKDQK